jgi:hypothetical protein
MFSRQLLAYAMALRTQPENAIYSIDLFFNEENVQRVFEQMVMEVGEEFRLKDTNNIVKESIEEGWTRKVREYLGVYGGRKISEINTFTKRFVLRKLRPILIEGTDEGLGIDQIARNIIRNIAEYSGNFAKFRAERIARTEVISTANGAGLESAKTAGVAGLIRKRWFVTVDGRERSNHEQMRDHPAIPLDQDFRVPRREGGFDAMAHPGDPRGSAGNVINCRCSIVYERIDQG